MPTDVPQQLEAEAATAELLRLAFLEIRFLLSTPNADEVAEVADRRRDQAQAIADACHNLPGLLAPERRDRLVDGLRYTWRTSNPRKQHWLRTRWDDLGYDHRWLTELGAEPSGVDSDGASGG